MFISETERAKVILMKFLTHRISAYSTATFRRNRFPATFGGHLEFLHKTYLSWKQREIDRF